MKVWSNLKGQLPAVSTATMISNNSCCSYPTGCAGCVRGVGFHLLQSSLTVAAEGHEGGVACQRAMDGRAQVLPLNRETQEDSPGRRWSRTKDEGEHCKPPSMCLSCLGQRNTPSNGSPTPPPFFRKRRDKGMMTNHRHPAGGGGSTQSGRIGGGKGRGGGG